MTLTVTLTPLMEQEALDIYRRARDNDPTDVGAILGCLKCLDALGEWEALVDLCHETWTLVDNGEDSVKSKAASLAAR